MADQFVRPQAPVIHPDSVEHRRQLAERANISLPKDGSQPMTQPLPLASFTVAGVPDATLWEGGFIYVSDETGGATTAFSDGTDWRRSQDRAIIA